VNHGERVMGNEMLGKMMMWVFLRAHVPVLRRTNLELLRVAETVLRRLGEDELVGVDERPEEEERSRGKLSLISVSPTRNVAPQLRSSKRLGLPVVKLRRSTAGSGSGVNLFRVDSVLRVEVLDLSPLSLVDAVDETVHLELGTKLSKEGKALLLPGELNEVRALAHLSGTAGRHLEDLLLRRIEGDDVELLEGGGSEETSGVTLEARHRSVGVESRRGESVWLGFGLFVGGGSVRSADNATKVVAHHKRSFDRACLSSAHSGANVARTSRDDHHSNKPEEGKIERNREPQVTRHNSSELFRYVPQKISLRSTKFEILS